MSNPIKCGCGTWTFLDHCPNCGEYVEANDHGRDDTKLVFVEEEAAPGVVTVTCDEGGQCVAVTRNDEEGKILSVIWEAP